MSCCFEQCPTETIVDPPIRVVRHVCHPQLIRVIHPIEIVTRHHCVPVFQHCRVVTEVDESPEVVTRSTNKRASGKKGRISSTKSRNKNIKSKK